MLDSSPNLPVIAWDVDDVLNDLTAAWLAFHNQRLGTDIGFADLRRNPPTDVLGITAVDYLASLDAFRCRAYGRLVPSPAVRQWFSEHGAGYRHLAVTAVPLAYAPRSAAWVLRHYGSWIRTFHFVPSARPGQGNIAYERTKADFLKRFDRVDFFIDDSEANTAPVEALGIKVIVFPRPWNRNHGVSAAELLQRELNCH